MTSFRKINSKEDTVKFAQWIYSTDKFLFNHVYKDKNTAIEALNKLINCDYVNEYHRDFITLIYDDNPDEPRGLSVSFRGNQVSRENTFKALESTGCATFSAILLNSLLGRFFASNIGYDDYYIGNLYVDEKYRKKGVGSKLVEKCKQTARQQNCRNVLLDVDYDKSYLLDFYGKLGFIKDSKNYHKILATTYGCYGLKYKLR